MKPTTIFTGRILFAVAFLGLSLFLVSWDMKQTGRNYQTINDTTPPKPAKPAKPVHPKEKKSTDLDDVLDELNHVEFKIEMEKVQKELDEAMKELKEVDVNKIKLELEQSLKEVDMNKIKLELEKSLKEIDMAKIKADVENSMAKVDWDKIKKELEEFRTIELDKIEFEMNKARAEFEKIAPRLEVEMKKLREEMDKLGPKLEIEMQKAKEGLEKAKAEMKAYKEFVDGLEKDGLLNKKEEYTINYKDGVLTVNGKIASKEIYDKYRGFLEKNKEFSIKKTADDFDIDID